MGRRLWPHRAQGLSALALAIVGAALGDEIGTPRGLQAVRGVDALATGQVLLQTGNADALLAELTAYDGYLDVIKQCLAQAAGNIDPSRVADIRITKADSTNIQWAFAIRVPASVTDGLTDAQYASKFSTALPPTLDALDPVFESTGGLLKVQVLNVVLAPVPTNPPTSTTTVTQTPKNTTATDSTPAPSVPELAPQTLAISGAILASIVVIIGCCIYFRCLCMMESGTRGLRIFGGRATATYKVEENEDTAKKHIVWEIHTEEHGQNLESWWTHMGGKKADEEDPPTVEGKPAADPTAMKAALKALDLPFGAPVDGALISGASVKSFQTYYSEDASHYSLNGAPPGIPLFKDGAMVDYFSLTNRTWIRGQIHLTPYRDELGDAGFVYNVVVSRRQRRAGVALDSMREPLVEGESVEVFGRDGSWYPARVLLDKTHMGLVVRFLSEEGQAAYLGNDRSSRASNAEGGEEGLEAVRVPSHYLRRRWTPGMDVEVYTGANEGWKLAVVAGSDADQEEADFPAPLSAYSPTRDSSGSVLARGATVTGDAALTPRKEEALRKEEANGAKSPRAVAPYPWHMISVLIEGGPVEKVATYLVRSRSKFV